MHGHFAVHWVLKCTCLIAKLYRDLHGSTYGTEQQNNQATQAQQPRAQRDIKPLSAPVFGVTNKLYAFGSGGEYFEKLFEKITEKVKALNEDTTEVSEKYSVIKLLKSSAGLNYSGIVIAEKIGNRASGHILIVERTGDYPEKILEMSTVFAMRFFVHQLMHSTPNMCVKR